MGCLAGSCCLWLGAVSLVPCVEWRHVMWEGSGCQGWLWGVDPQWWLSFNLMKGNVGFGPPALGIAGSRGHFPRAGVRLGTHIRAPCSWLQAQSSSQDGQRCLSLHPHPAGPPPSTSQLTDWNLGGSGDICAPSRSPCPSAGSNQMLGAAGGCPHGSAGWDAPCFLSSSSSSVPGLIRVRLRAWREVMGSCMDLASPAPGSPWRASWGCSRMRT